MDIFTSPPVGVRSVGMSMSVHVCLSVCSCVSKTTCPNFMKMFCTCYLWPWLGPFLKRM